MKCVILAGGKGTRISELTKSLPKPMIRVKGKPLIYFIMKHYYKHGITNFIVAAGYKKKIIEDYFKKNKFKWKVKVVNTGLNTMTGGRLKRLKRYLKDETFLLTYGDGISNINIKKLINFHHKKKNLVTLTAVRPPARFGALKIKDGKVIYFKEKSKSDEGWINGGFFVIEKRFLNLIKNDDTFLEKQPLEKACKQKKLYALKHYGFWQCVDTLRDLQRLKKTNLNF